QVLSVGGRVAPRMLEGQARFLRFLERQGRINRAIEALPSDEELAERRAAGLGFTGPERAVLLAYAKIWLRGELLASDLPFAYSYTWEDAQEALGADADHLFSLLVSDGSTLYGLNSLNGSLYPLTFADGQTIFGPAVTLDWDAIDEHLGDGDYVELLSPNIINNTLYLLMHTYEDYETTTLMSFDLTTGEADTWPVDSVQDITPYRDGRLLVELYDYQTAYNTDTGEVANPTLAIFDPADGSVTEIGYFGNVNVYGIVYDADSDTLYYTTNSKLMAMVSLGEAVQVAYLPADYINSPTACMLPGGLYAILTWDALIVRNTDPQYMPSSSLSIYNGYIDDAAIAFMADYPDVPLTFNDDVYFSTSSAMAQAMVSGDDAFDVYNISLSYQDFASLMDKGYCMDLSQYSSLTDTLSQLYPFLQDAISKDGHFYAVPDYMYAYGLSIIPDTWEELGLTDRIPTSFMGLLDFLQWWTEEGIDEYPDMQLVQDAYDYGSFLFDMAMDLYINQYQAEGKDLTLDTPLFREMMEAIEDLDIDALNDTIPEMDEDDMYVYSDDSSDDYLFTRYEDWLSVSADQSYSTPLVLPIEEGGTAYLPVYVQALFVNPHTEHPELAAAYLQCVLDNMEESQHVMMFPDDNDAIPYPYYDEIVEYYETALADAQASLETAAPENVKDIQTTIDNYQDLLDHKDEYYWLATEESIASYREMASLCYTATPNILSYSSNDEGSSEITTLIERYNQQQITLDQFITQTDQKIRMIQLEMQ
ncbi:MAG TPA: extracellular solute-binding protein, partial [Candidatus Limiplasma sp.]|nr:extracellular solute-binding protein [Candidatus Limiplasma sp.]